jgi:hypothetical protein
VPDTDYPRGAVKQDPATKRTAIRTGHPADAPNAWFVGDLDNGGHWAPLAEVEELADVKGTPVPDPKQPEPSE